MTLLITAAFKMGGIILWGKGDNMDGPQKCGQVYDYMTNIFGPALKSVRSEIADQGFFQKMLKYVR